MGARPCEEAAHAQCWRLRWCAGGLDETVNEAVLHAAFIPFGDIKDVNIPLDQTTQKNRGFGFITYMEKGDAAAAMDNMHNSELYGRVSSPLSLAPGMHTSHRRLLLAPPSQASRVWISRRSRVREAWLASDGARTKRG
jgi:hypothetical protein